MASSLALFTSKISIDPSTKPIEVKESSPLDKAIEKFDYWMKNYDHKPGTDKEKLLRWLTYDRGVKYAQSYPFFQEMAEALTKINYKTSPPPSEAEYRDALGLHVLVPESKRTCLRELQNNFSDSLLTTNAGYVSFSREESLFLYSNDASRIKNYLIRLFKSIQSIKKSSEGFTLLQSLAGKKDLIDIGIVIGNSHILSLLPDFPLDVFLVLDVEPLLHLFLLKTKELILNTNDKEDFETIRTNLMKEIDSIQSEIESESCEGSVATEMKILGDKHFLSSKERFAECKKALQSKELIPIKVDMFKEKKVEKLGELLKKVGCQITFMNLTNIADYDRCHILPSALNHLPFTATTVFISTALVGFSSRHCHPKCFVSIGKSELDKSFKYSYFWNTPQNYYGGYGFSFI